MAIDFKSPAARAGLALLVTGLGVFAAVIAFPDHAYRWVKALHVVAVISWMAGMLYLPRLFVYHCDVPPGSAQAETFTVMERRLLGIIINPAMIVTWISGLWLVWQLGAYLSAWFLVKFAAVLLMSVVHGHLSAALRRFADGTNTRSVRYWRMMNEVPAVLMIVIVVMVIVRPF